MLSAATGIEVVKSSMCGYVLARYRFPGRNLIYGVISGNFVYPDCVNYHPTIQSGAFSRLAQYTVAGVILGFEPVAQVHCMCCSLPVSLSTIPEELFR